MQPININPSKNQTKIARSKDIKSAIWEASIKSHPVTFDQPDEVLKACRLKSCDLTGAKAYSLFIPMFGTHFQTSWYL